MSGRPVLVCGLGRFGLRCVTLLRDAGVPVIVITDPRTRADRKARAQELDVTLVEGDFRFPDVRALAQVGSARAVILASSFDGANLEAALDLRRDHPELRIVMRFASDKLAARLQADFGIDAVLSPPVLAAPGFAEAALQPAPTAAPPLRGGPAAEPPPASSRPLSGLSPLDGKREARLLISVLAALFLGAVLLFHEAMRLTWVDALYFASTIVTTVGFGDFNLHDAPLLVKLFGVLLMFGGVTLIAILSSMLTNFLLSGAAIQYRIERVVRRMRGHIIVCGLGSVGYEVATDLRLRGIPLVIVDATPDDLHVRMLSARVPILVGDAASPEMLLRAGLPHARSVIVVTSDDAVNLEIGLTAQTLVEEHRPDRPMRLVLRCFDPDLARRIHAVSAAYTLLSSAEVAAPIFVREALQTRAGTAAGQHEENQAT